MCSLCTTGVKGLMVKLEILPVDIMFTREKYVLCIVSLKFILSSTF